ncbi:frataxin like [Cryptosporidium sp. chipmunk genotype I]|uniref:frataxin like n=1 Tax=Cryptosporidium sp. chipmunk genotype I TaxID=1280935 RepID=UPI003519E791|nr:frataxin like [Cryptosporidium sp. chipmunk genotype I]
MNSIKLINLKVVQNLSKFNSSCKVFNFSNSISTLRFLCDNNSKFVTPLAHNLFKLKKNKINTNSLDISQFGSKTEKLFFEIESKLSNLLDNGFLTDIDLHDEFMNIIFNFNGERSTIVISKQPATKQIWYSSPLRKPDYFEFSSDWRSNRTNKTLFEVLHDDLLKATGIHVNF